jgi:cell division protein FtsQ
LRIASIVVLTLLVLGAPWWSAWIAEVMAGQLLDWNLHFRVNRVVVSGCQILSGESITELAKIPLRQSMFTLPMAAIVKRVEQNPWVKSVRVIRRLPDTVELAVKERIPVAAVRGDRLMVLTADSVAISPPPRNWVWDLPIVTPPRAVQFADAKRVSDNTVLQLLHQVLVARTASDEMWNNLSEVYISQGQVRAMINAPRVEIIVGESTGELAWIGLAKYLSQSDMTAEPAPASIDLRIPGKLVVAAESMENKERVSG